MTIIIIDHFIVIICTINIDIVTVIVIIIAIIIIIILIPLLPTIFVIALCFQGPYF